MASVGRGQDHDVAQFISGLQRFKFAPQVAQDFSERRSAVPNQIAQTDACRTLQRRMRIVYSAKSRFFAGMPCCGREGVSVRTYD